jgi:hypothetical protein
MAASRREAQAESRDALLTAIAKARGWIEAAESPLMSRVPSMKAKRDIRLLASAECQAVIAVPILLLACVDLNLRRLLLVAVARNSLRILFGVWMGPDRNVLEASAHVYRPAFALFSGSRSISPGRAACLFVTIFHHLAYRMCVRSA